MVVNTSVKSICRSDLEAVLTAVLRNISSHESHQSEPSSDREVLDIFLNAANLTTDDTKCAESCMSFEEFRSWCARLPSVRKFLGTLLSPRDSGSEVPMLVYPENIDPAVILLRKEYGWHIGGALPQDELHEWRLLYHSTVHGLSFSTFLGNISNDKGPTLLVIKDKEGYIYGGYASQPWEKHADFYGDMKSFLFQLYPEASVYRPTGANSNLQWNFKVPPTLQNFIFPIISWTLHFSSCNSLLLVTIPIALEYLRSVILLLPSEARSSPLSTVVLIFLCAIHFSSESIPNGIGFGGRAHHFGLFISANFDQGHTFTCTTFGSPSLSKTHQIYPEVIECWGVAIKRAQDNQDRLQGTVLERFKEDRHMLNMIGLANSSE
ncbi:hypothetical protein H5410_053759 [Solanum commersonii]|uniref:TLDc domain-containing protein n=1 Tax=Solanum commersonii TaxID=4109 RepID=A0A9J5X791_SOLCO|nr:hypothetical protein H5410_053759 [Solanum commersonii]